MEVEQRVWGFSDEGEPVVLYTMRNDNGAYVELTNIGAAIVSVCLPDREGRLADVALGYNRFESYVCDSPAMGKTVGRFANRIAKGCFTLEGKEYYLVQNNGVNHLHGGIMGFANKMWQSRVEVNRVVFSLISPDGDQGYPGELAVEVIYDWDEDNVLEITYLAKSDATTIVNLTNHTYFNLAGHDSGSVLNHTLQLNAEKFLPTDSTQIPTGEYDLVSGTPMDFRRAKPLGQDIDANYEPLKIGYGYDHCWIVDGWESGKMADIGTLYDQKSGRLMTVRSTQPGVQIYTGNWLQGCPEGKYGMRYENRAGVAIECQGFPDAPNKPHFPSQILREGELFQERISFGFSVM